MYDLRVYLPDQHAPIKTVVVASAAEAMAAIPRLLAEHDGCERVSVIAGTLYLFSVDCAGNRLRRDKP